YLKAGQNLVGRFRQLQDEGAIEILTCAATHAVLPLLAPAPESINAQLQIARDYHVECFGKQPAGIWLPECAYFHGLDEFLRQANLQWFVLESHGLAHAQPPAVHGCFSPVVTQAGVAAFGRDVDSARQVWSRHGGYPGDSRYRDFYRDVGFDADLEYVGPYL